MIAEQVKVPNREAPFNWNCAGDEGINTVLMWLNSFAFEALLR